MLLTDPAPAAAPALLDGAYRRLREVSPLLRITRQNPPQGADWVTGRQLAEDAELRDRLVVAETARVKRMYGTAPRRDVAATWVLHRYAFTVCLAISGPWYLARRVPRLDPADVGYQWRDRTLTVAPSGVTCLPGGGRAVPPGGRSVPDEEALRAELRASVAAHLGPVLAGFRPLLRRGPRALWGMATDELTEGLTHLGRVLNEPQAAADAASAVLPGATPPYAGGAGFRPSAGSGGAPTRIRTGCCLYYTLRPEAVCSGCPRNAAGRTGS